jgi:predicted nucleic acid-binding protein
VLVRHLTGDPAAQARRARHLLESGETLILTDVICAELVYVLESVYSRPRQEVAVLIRSLLGFPSIAAADSAVLLRAVEHYDVHRLDFAEAYLAALAEASGIRRVASFDRQLDRVATVDRIESGQEPPGPALTIEEVRETLDRVRKRQ